MPWRAAGLIIVLTLGVLDLGQIGPPTVALEAAYRRSGAVMSEWEQVTLNGELTLTVPTAVSRGPEQGVDTKVATWSGAGINILVDQGPFVDPLVSYRDRVAYQSLQETIGGRVARIVSFVEGDGTRIVAAHFSGSEAGSRDRLTVVIRSDPAVLTEEVVFKIIRSLRFGGR